VAAAGDTVDTFRPAPGFLSYLRFQFFIGMSAIGVGLTVLWFVLLVNKPLAGAVLAPVFLIAFVVPQALAWVSIRLRYDTTWYVMSDRSLRLRRGIWTIRETTITFENVQNVELSQGPVQRHFGIANLVVKTAGGGDTDPKHPSSNPHRGVVEGVDDAERIRDAIMSRVRRSRRAGLGDERPDPVRAGRRGSAGWTAAHLDELRAIRDAVNAARP
jgi:uncharacterized membrane protein YdbT with pleckstrin-like domain